MDATGLRGQLRYSLQVLVKSGSNVVIDASSVEKKQDKATSLVMFPIQGVFSNPKAVFLGFGVPNTYLVIPREESNPANPAWDKFAAFMLWRKPASVENTEGTAQAGVLFELCGLPDEALSRLRAAMAQYSDKRCPSCANINARVLDTAGFTSGGKRLTGVFRPSRLASRLWRRGLEYDGMPVDLRIIQTSDQEVTDHFVSVWTKEVTSLYRLVKKTFQHSSDEPEPLKFNLELDAASELAATDGKPIMVGISCPSFLGAHLGALLGQHPIFAALPNAPVGAPELAIPLKPFPGSLSTISKIKKYILFSRPVVWLIRRNLMARTDYYPDIPSSAIPSMLRTSPSPDQESAYKYNLVMTSDQVLITRLRTPSGRSRKRLDWLLSKHVLVSGYNRDVRFPGEVWRCVEDGKTVIYLTADSGTYKPGAERLLPAAQYFAEVFNVEVRAVSTR